MCVHSNPQAFGRGSPSDSNFRVTLQKQIVCISLSHYSLNNTYCKVNILQSKELFWRQVEKADAGERKKQCAWLAHLFGKYFGQQYFWFNLIVLTAWPLLWLHHEDITTCYKRRTSKADCHDNQLSSGQNVNFAHNILDILLGKLMLCLYTLCIMNIFKTFYWAESIHD